MESFTSSVKTIALSSLYIKCGKESVHNVRLSITLGMASSVANNVTMRMTS